MEPSVTKSEFLTLKQMVEAVQLKEASCHAQITEKINYLEMDRTIIKETMTEVWNVINQLKDSLTGVRVQVAAIVGAFGILQTIITGALVHYMTK